MKKTVPPIPPRSRFGWPKPGRIEEFRKLSAKPTGATHRVVFQGKTQDLPIIRVPIELPKYRMENGRTSSLQAEYLAKNPKKRADLFTGDAELWDAQEAQHELLLQYAQQSNLQAYFENTANVQVPPILLDENGFVVNGNRRLATWRDLLFKSAQKYGHFRYIDVVILPHSTDRDIDRLEVKLQIEEDIQADYIWHAHANMMLAQQKRYGFSNKDLAELHGIKETKVEELFDMRAYASEYLRSRGKADIWSLVTEHEFAFRKIVVSRAKIKGIGNQELFKQAAFSLIDKPDEAGVRLYEAIPAIMEGLDQVKEKLQQEFKVKPAQPDNSLKELFGGSSAKENGDSIDMPLAKEIQKSSNAEKARKIIVDVIESQKQLKKDAKSAGYLLECCAKAQAWLAAGVKDGLRPETKTTGVAKQLDQLHIQIDKIKAYVAKHAKN